MSRTGGSLGDDTTVLETTARILDGKAVAAEIRAEVAQRVAELLATGGRRPGLAAVLVGDDPASKVYVGSKKRASEEVGMLGRVEILPSDTPRERVDALLDELNGDDAIDGILVQLPLPEHLPERPIVERVLPEKDVDGFHPLNVGSLWLDQRGLAPATPSGVIELLHRSGIEIAGRRAVVVGRSAIVGKPMAGLLLREHATVTVCHSRTRDLPAVCREADILVAAVGRAGVIGPEHVREGAVVVDVGMNRLTERAQVDHFFPGDAHRRDVFERRGSTLVGDVDFTRVARKAAAITPVPGGVGPLTVAMLLVNTLAAARRRQGLD
ncbi:MAG TPA: bifunctional methylenetetrahydrofolate dehydrogenase/methenyltetrahydrofolate cyclohydrolase FolD [Thermoanaerobaculia bacterium]|nr:bifunctional methylenetetrahydrofolate dehydrogenase/methenyltetrahydrofolate cyclohydrolase FolD [Thermoanaerobaculia bacterium]